MGGPRGRKGPAPEKAPSGAKNGRGDRIRTCDLYVPNVALYQAKLRPDFFAEGQGSLAEVGVASRKAEVNRLSAESQIFYSESKNCELFCEPNA